MKRKLFKQLIAEWRPNIWLFLELLVVSLVLWWINDYMYIVYRLKTKPYGYDTENVYRVNYSWYMQNLPEDTDIQALADSQMNKVMARLRAEPGVEAACLSAGMVVYSQDNISSIMTLAGDSTITMGNDRSPLPRFGVDARGDICKTLDIHGVNGETPEELDELLRQGKMLVTENVGVVKADGGELPTDKRIDASNVVGQTFLIQNLNNAPLTVGAVIPVQRRCTYEMTENWISTILPRSVMPGAWGNIYVRVKDTYPGDFIRDMSGKIAKDYTLEHIYVTDIEAMEDVRALYDLEDDQQYRFYVMFCAFLGMNVFLGLLGAFWFRTQQRASEIAIRMVNGATPRRILVRVIAEPLLLLIFTLPFSVAGIWLLYHSEAIFLPDVGWGFVWIMAWVGAVTYAEMAVMVVLGVLFPALKAMRTRPATVLQEE